MFLILSCFSLFSLAYTAHRCDIKHCLVMKDTLSRHTGTYNIEEPTEEERLYCESKSERFCFRVEGETNPVTDHNGCVTKVLEEEKGGSRYCFHKEREIDAEQNIPVKMLCHRGIRDGEKKASPYECPDLEHYEGWDYRYHKNDVILGPTKWSQKFPKCDGPNESPVDLVTSSMDKVDKSTVDPIRIFGYGEEGVRKEKWRVENNGHSAEVELLETHTDREMYMIGGPLKKEDDDDGKYNLLQLHFHWGNTSQQGSEHTVDGKEFPMEMHLVHISNLLDKENKSATADGDVSEGLAVLGFLFEVTEKDNVMLLPITNLLKKIPNWREETEFEEEFPDIDALVKDALNGDFFSYSGSLTTPPCNPVVRWIVFKNTIKISEAQLREFWKLRNRHEMELLNNHRPVQPLNGRKVQHYQ